MPRESGPMAFSNLLQAVVVVPATNELTPVRSVLPDRFVSDSNVHGGSIMPAGLGSSIDLKQDVHLIIPAEAEA